MKIALLNPKWGPVNILRQTSQYSGISSNAQFYVHPDKFSECDYVLVGSPEQIQEAQSFSREKRVYVCMENPQIWMPSFEFLSQIGNILTPFPQTLDALAPACNIIESYPCVPWFYGIEFSTSAGLTHVPLQSTSELDSLLGQPLPAKTKLLSVILSSKGGTPGYDWRLEFVNALTRHLPGAVDVYGFGHNPLPNKKDALDPYVATIVIENSSHPSYITEKIADAVIGWAMPIYCGSSSISSLLPDYPWSLVFGSDIDTCCRHVELYMRQILRDTSCIFSIRKSILRRLNLFDEVPSQLEKL